MDPRGPDFCRYRLLRRQVLLVSWSGYCPGHIRTRLRSSRFYRRRQAADSSRRPAASLSSSGCYRQDQRGPRGSSRPSDSEEDGSEARETFSEEEEWQTVPLRLRRTLPSVHSLEESHFGRQQRELRIGIGQESFLRIELDLVFEEGKHGWRLLLVEFPSPVGASWQKKIQAQQAPLGSQPHQQTGDAPSGVSPVC